MDKRKNLVTYIFLIFSIYILVFQNVLQSFIKPIQYFDEILAIIFFPIFLIATEKEKIKKSNLIITICLSILLFVGLYSNFKFSFQSVQIAFSDVLLVYKFFLVYFLFSTLNKNKGIDFFKKGIIGHLKFISIVLFLLTVINYIFKIFPYEYRYGIMSNKLFYSHPTYLAAICIFIICTFIFFFNKKNIKYIMLMCTIVISTLRMKAIAFLFVFAIIVLFVTKTNKRITFSKLTIIAIICLLVAYNQIQFYFFKTEDSARSILLNTSFKIANDYFPIGTGFGTYASHFSAQSYSPVYSMYNIQNTYGLSKGNTIFISDSFWPMIIGQFGYIGLICYAIAIISILRKIQMEYKPEEKYKYIAKITALAYLVISSTSESAFVNPIAIPLAIIIGL